MGGASLLHAPNFRHTTNPEALPILRPVIRKFTTLFAKERPKSRQTKSDPSEETPSPVISDPAATVATQPRPGARPASHSANGPKSLTNGHAPRRRRRRRRRRKPAGAAAPVTNRAAVAPTASANGAVRQDVGPISETFGDIRVSPPVARSLAAMGYREPTPIQAEVIPLVRSGRDVVGQAQTGTGKTASFGIPLVEMVDTRSADVQALILTPTRELAMQVRDELIRLGEYRGVKTVALYGGQAMSKQLTALGRRAHLVVATPGRLMDHMERGTVRLDRLKAAVLDEADQMLDIGFAPDIAYILRRTPRSRQTLLFSATMPGPIRSLAYRYLRNPDWIRVGGEAEPVKEVRQVYYEVAERDRDRLLHSLLRDPKGITQALVFRRTKVGVDWLERNLRRSGLDAQAIHGDMTQAQRNAVMKRFRAKDLRILVATNVASRGLDIPAVSHVINYDMPDNLEEYVHRIGRTARMGRTGTALLFVSEWDFDALEMIQSHVGDRLREATAAPAGRNGR